MLPPVAEFCLVACLFVLACGLFPVITQLSQQDTVTFTRLMVIDPNPNLEKELHESPDFRPGNEF
jgi:hypothetical protein